MSEGAEMVRSYSYHMDGQLASASDGRRAETFLGDGLALIRRDGTNYLNEPAITGGNPVMAGDKVLFNDLLGSTLGAKSAAGYAPSKMTAFGESADTSVFFTGKPQVDGLGYAFLFRNYRPDQGKWQTADPLGYPDGWNNFAYCNNRILVIVDLYGCVNWSTIWRGTKAVLGGSAEIVTGCFLVANVETAGASQVAGVLFFMDGLGRVGLGIANITQGTIDQPDVPVSYVEVAADIVTQLTDADDSIVDNAAKIVDYAIGLASPTTPGGKLVDILGALDDIATFDDALHDVVDAIESLLEDLGIKE